MEEKEMLLIRAYIEEHAAEAERLLKDLSVIPAPSGKEERRASFILKWLNNHGAKGAYLDEEGNVIFPYEADKREKLLVYMAHMDVVFPDEDKLIIKQDKNKLIGPGVGDDTANLAILLMTCAYFIEKKPSMSAGILFVCDVCEEGLGNLKGIRQIMKDFGSRICQVVSFDLYLGQCFDTCVGSLRYEVTVRTEGGHSFSDFGKTSAIAKLSEIILKLYSQKVFDKGQTTFNVGTIEGGTSVNTIAQSASLLYEIRSVDQAAMEEMRKSFERIIKSFLAEGLDVIVRPVGDRPCAGEMTKENKERMEALVKRVSRCIKKVTGKDCELSPASTDANIPLSLGIPSVTLGTIAGGGAHTRQEWIDLHSLKSGMELALLIALDFF